MQKERRKMDWKESLQKEFEACQREYADASPLSDEELDRIIKDIRRSIRKEEVQ
ncbi:hypothetical protein [Brevibacillus agri]|uniref:hypothetical protein n=1 Tax=Brevibacillus agri TaxID=51101 RepID=UPI003D22ED10